ncbi:hypothetical protein [Deinococcus pimensis]|uniref:hypothetical protein n=1 Tax=Deinococcus pimensis TaxID=309888 RepID=UPI000483E34D|nr:hypothetical protein [Deinococcus pimensis]
MDQPSTSTPSGNPRPGVIFHHGPKGQTVILNPDLTITTVKDGQSNTYRLTYDQWRALMIDCYDALIGFLPDCTLGETGRRIAENYEAHVIAKPHQRSWYA